MTVVTSDQEARRLFTEAVLPQTGQALRLARWFTHNLHDAEDIVQDASLRAFRSIADCKGANPRAWFLAIVRNTARTWLAKNRPKDIKLSDDLESAERANPTGEPAFGAASPETPEAALLEHERGNRVTRAVASLPLRYREPLILREVNGMSYREIADVLDMPIGTVMSRLARARGILVEALAEEKP